MSNYQSRDLIMISESGDYGNHKNSIDEIRKMNPEKIAEELAYRDYLIKSLCSSVVVVTDDLIKIGFSAIEDAFDFDEIQHALITAWQSRDEAELIKANKNITRKHWGTNPNPGSLN